MAFSIVHTDHALQAWEYIPADAGTYTAGQALKISNGKLTKVTPALTTVPPYICMTNRTVLAGETIPVIRVTELTTFEVPLSTTTAGAKPGALLQVADGGIEVNQTAAGSFEVIHAAGTAKGDLITGRFKVQPGAGA